MNSSDRVKASSVREMFGSIARRYDLLNHVLSGNIDRRWRQRAARDVGRRIRVSNPRILDVGCGTADLSLACARFGNVVGCDFCHPMILLAKHKIARSGESRCVVLLAGDALKLPFVDSTFDAVVSAFVLRNLANLKEGLAEMRRVLKRGGVLGILDFSMPTAPVFRELYHFYFTRVLPRLGKILSGVDGPYSYLPESVRDFPSPDRLANILAEAGFVQIECERLTGGIAILFLANTPLLAFEPEPSSAALA